MDILALFRQSRCAVQIRQLKRLQAIGAIGALMNGVHQPRTLVVLELNAGMGTAAGADELVDNYV